MKLLDWDQKDREGIRLRTMWDRMFETILAHAKVFLENFVGRKLLLTMQMTRNEVNEVRAKFRDIYAITSFNEFASNVDQKSTIEFDAALIRRIKGSYEWGKGVTNFKKRMLDIIARMTSVEKLLEICILTAERRANYNPSFYSTYIVGENPSEEDFSNLESQLLYYNGMKERIEKYYMESLNMAVIHLRHVVLDICRLMETTTQ